MTVINYCPKLIVSCRVVLCRLGVIWAISSAVARLLMFIEFVYIRFVRRAKVEVLYECLVFALWSFLGENSVLRLWRIIILRFTTCRTACFLRLTTCVFCKVLLFSQTVQHVPRPLISRANFGTMCDRRRY